MHGGLSAGSKAAGEKKIFAGPQESEPLNRVAAFASESVRGMRLRRLQADQINK